MDEMKECGRKFAHADHTCRRLLEPDGRHLGLHRNARTAKFATVMWGENECAPAEEQPHGAEATVSTYRIHMIISVQGEERPRSFRTEELAVSFDDAREHAKQSLAELAHAEGWTGMYEVLSEGSVEKVPGTTGERL